MIIISSALAAIIPMSIYLLLIWKFDRYDTEPFKLVFTNYIWGAFGAVFFALIGSHIFTTVLSLFVKNPLLLKNLSSVVIAPIVEETTKGLFLIITIANKKFDNITDGIVYGGAIGLGFGMTENFLYFVNYSQSHINWIVLVIVRSLFSGVLHFVATAAFGALLGIAKFQTKYLRITISIIGLLAAIIIHSLWNISQSFDRIVPIGFVFLILSVIIIVIIFRLSLKSERKIIFNELKEETELGIIPKSHLLTLSSPHRERKGWFDEQNRKLYIKAATALAFRKVQARKSSGISKTYYEQDIIYFRKLITNLLSKT